MRGARRLRLALLVLVAGLCGCRPDSPTPTTHPVALELARKRTPSETIQQLVDARGARRYDEVAARVIPEAADVVVSTLRAVDAFAAANQALFEHVRDHYDLLLANSLDCSGWYRRLDIFSRHIRLVTERIEGDEAHVAFVANDELPHLSARLELRDGTWLYDPGPGADRRLARAFERMAADTQALCNELAGGSISAEQVRSDPLWLVGELQRRLSTGVGMLPQP